MSDNASLFARIRNNRDNDIAEKQNRRSSYYAKGKLARESGVPKEENPLRYVPGKSSPDHPDIWEAQWDLGWEEGKP